ncbi:MAG: DUF6088 family protein [Porphyromonadaceae bacterium]|nr:DUF6088 family protein [Porphyromonadaceae bacterium]
MNISEQTLKQQILSSENDTIYFRNDFPQYHPESVGRVLSDLADNGELVRIASGIYVKPRMSRFGPVMPSIEHIVKAIAIRDKAQILPSGETALNALGLSTQMPMSYSFLTTGSARKLTIGKRQVTLKRGVPRNFAYKTQLIALIVQALRCLGEPNVSPREVEQVQKMIMKEPDKQALISDVQIMPAWMKRIIKPMIK